MVLKTPGLYIHIPFCLSKCHYCDFYSLTSISAIPVFLEALFKEMEMYCNRFNPFDTINIGVQSFDEKVLDFLGRRHSAKQAISAIEASRKAGFCNIGLDLIYGVPEQGIDSWLDTKPRLP